MLVHTILERTEAATAFSEGVTYFLKVRHFSQGPVYFLKVELATFSQGPELF